MTDYKVNFKDLKAKVGIDDVAYMGPHNLFSNLPLPQAYLFLVHSLQNQRM